MSSPLAIASVTYVIKDLLNNGLIDHDITSIGNVKVTALPPDRIETTVNLEESQLNLFMYLVTPNQGWRNNDLPTRNAKGELTSQPLLALDLHYLLTAYGGQELHQEILLGYGMLLLHENPVLTREAIRVALAPPALANPSATLPAQLRILSTSGLADQIERIKITPETLNTEEISRLWTAFGAKYRPNAAYKATVVLIQSQKSTKPTLPVRQRNLYVMPFHQPVIERFSSQAPTSPPGPIVDNQKILANYLLILRGYQLKAESVLVKIDKEEIAPEPNMTDSEITVRLPPTLKAGIQGVQVVHNFLMGSPPKEHKGVNSNVQAFVLCPKIIKPIGIANVTGVSLKSADISLTVEPIVHKDQQVILLMNEMNSNDPNSYSFIVNTGNLPEMPSSPPSPTTLLIAIKNVKPGTYLIRLQVDGAESPLEIVVGPHYDSPSITIV